jgi:hypothetical protein
MVVGSLLDNINHPHLFHNNIDSSQSSQPDFSQQQRPQCQICGRIGHIAVKCWYRYDYSYDTTENSSQAFVATMVSDPQKSNPNWYTDTGANSHMTSNPGNLDDSQSYIGNDHVMVGDGSLLPISHIGNTYNTRLFSWKIRTSRCACCA